MDGYAVRINKNFIEKIEKRKDYSSNTHLMKKFKCKWADPYARLDLRSHAFLRRFF